VGGIVADRVDRLHFTTVAQAREGLLSIILGFLVARQELRAAETEAELAAAPRGP
jgi:hypothetical protein